MEQAPRNYPFLAATTRVSAFLALLSAALLSNDRVATFVVLGIGVIWLVATVADRLGQAPVVTITLDAAFVGGTCALAASSETIQVMAALAFPPFLAGLRRGPRGVALALAAELSGYVAVAAVTGAADAVSSATALTWVIFGLGLGLIGSFVRSSYGQGHDPLGPYRNAQSLIRELIGLSGQLSEGLDPVSLASGIASSVHDELPVLGLVVHVDRGGEATAIVDDRLGTEQDPGVVEDLAEGAMRDGSILVAERAFALPLKTGANTVAVVSGFLSPGLDPVELGLHETLVSLQRRLEPATVHLDTALLFASFRDAATVEERRRLAREMHDGVAQEMASLGYLVDELLSESSSPELHRQLQVLRDRLTAVVGEVRRSVRTLRTSVGESPSLGTAIGAVARHLSEGSGIPIQVTLDEGTRRLRPEVEAELLRIAQEALTNAVRHSSATQIEVHCAVAPPAAEIIVTDDGTGLGARRSDSHGLEIMAERARLVQGELTVSPRAPHGTVVAVRVGEAAAGSVDPVSLSVPSRLNDAVGRVALS